MSRVSLCRAAEVTPGSIRQASLPNGRKLAVYNVGGCFYATDDVCTHGEASLAEDGLLDGHVVECSWHNGKFDVRDGKPCAMPCTEPLASYVVTIEDGELVTEVEA